MAREIGLKVEQLNGSSWSTLPNIMGVNASGGMLDKFSPSPRPGQAEITVSNDDGAYNFSEGLVARGTTIRVLVKSELGQCLRVYHTGTTAASYVQNVVLSGIEPGAHVVLTWEARAMFADKWNTDNAYIQDGSSQYFAATTQTYSNVWQTYTIDVSSATGGAFYAVVFQPDRTGSYAYQYIEYRNIRLTLDGVDQGIIHEDNANWTAHNPGSGTYHLSLVDDMYTVFYGTIEKIVRDTIPYGKRTARIMCVNGVMKLMRSYMHAPLQRDKTCDELASVALEYMASNPPASWKAWARESGARRYYRLNEAAGATTAIDSGTDGLDSTFVNAVTFGSDALLSNGDTSTSASFNGSTSYIYLPPLIIDRSFTLQAQINLLSIPQPQPILSFYDDSDNFYELRLELNSDADLVFSRNDATLITASDAITYNTTHLVTATFDYGSQTLTLYADGASVASGTVTPIAVQTTTIVVGFGVDSGYHASGKIQNIMLFDTALTADEVLDAYNATQFSEAKQKRWFPGVRLQACKRSFSVAFDQYAENKTMVFNGIEDAVNSEGGRFMVQSDGSLELYNRGWWPAWRTRLPGGLYEDTYRTLILGTNAAFGALDSEESGELCINRAYITYTPRTLGSDVVVLGSANGEIPPIKVGKFGDANAVPGTQKITVAFHNDAGNDYSGYDLQLPLTVYHSATPGDYDLRVWGDNSTMEDGTDYTPGGDDPLNRGQYCSYRITKITPREVEIEFKNWALGKLYVFVQVRGKSITAYEPITVNEKASGIIDDSDDERPITIQSPFLNNADSARQYAKYYIQNFGTPFEQIPSVLFNATRTIPANDYMPAAFDLFSLRYGDVVGFEGRESFYYHLVTGINYRLTPGDEFTVEVELARADRANVAVFGVGQFGNNVFGL